MGAIDRATLEAQAIVREVEDVTKIEKNDERFLKVRAHYTDAELLAALYFPTLLGEIRNLSPAGLSTMIASVAAAINQGEEIDTHLDRGRQIWQSFYKLRADAILKIDAHINIPTAEVENAHL